MGSIAPYNQGKMTSEVHLTERPGVKEGGRIPDDHHSQAQEGRRVQHPSVASAERGTAKRKVACRQRRGFRSLSFP